MVHGEAVAILARNNRPVLVEKLKVRTVCVMRQSSRLDKTHKESKCLSSEVQIDAQECGKARHRDKGRETTAASVFDAPVVQS